MTLENLGVLHKGCPAASADVSGLVPEAGALWQLQADAVG